MEKLLAGRICFEKIEFRLKWNLAAGLMGGIEGRVAWAAFTEKETSLEINDKDRALPRF